MLSIYIFKIYLLTSRTKKHVDIVLVNQNKFKNR